MLTEGGGGLEMAKFGLRNKRMVPNPKHHILKKTFP